MLPKLQVTLEQGSRVPVGRARWASGPPYIGQWPSAYPLISGPTQPFATLHRRPHPNPHRPRPCPALCNPPHRRPRPHPHRPRPPPPLPPPPPLSPHRGNRSYIPSTAGPRPLTAGPAAQQADAPLLAALRPLQLALVAVGGGIRAAHGRHHAGAGALLAHAGGSARLVCAGLADSAKATQHSSARCVWGGRCNGCLASAISRPPVTTHTDQCLHTCPDLAYACPPMFVLVLTGTLVCPCSQGLKPPPLNNSPSPAPQSSPTRAFSAQLWKGIASAPDPVPTQRADSPQANSVTGNQCLLIKTEAPHPTVTYSSEPGPPHHIPGNCSSDHPHTWPLSLPQGPPPLPFRVRPDVTQL